MRTVRVYAMCMRGPSRNSTEPIYVSTAQCISSSRPRAMSPAGGRSCHSETNQIELHPNKPSMPRTRRRRTRCREQLRVFLTGAHASDGFAVFRALWPGMLWASALCFVLKATQGGAPCRVLGLRGLGW